MGNSCAFGRKSWPIIKNTAFGAFSSCRTPDFVSTFALKHEFTHASKSHPFKPTYPHPHTNRRINMKTQEARSKKCGIKTKNKSQQRDNAVTKYISSLQSKNIQHADIRQLEYPQSTRAPRQNQRQMSY